MIRSRNAVVVATGVVAVVAATAAFRVRGAEHRDPFERPVAGAAAPTVRTVGRVRYVSAPDTPSELLPDTLAPSGDVQLLWLGGQVAHPTTEGAIALDAGGGVVEFDRRLRPQQLAIEAEGREWLSVAAGPRGSVWLTDATGRLLLAAPGKPVRTAPAMAFHYSTVASDPRTGTPWLARSPHRFAYALDTADSPLLAQGDSTGVVARTLGVASRPEHILLRDLANAGHIAVGTTVVYFAPFVRDELVALTPAGDTLWVASRGLTHGTAEPRFEVRGKQVMIDYSPVNLGLTIGPDGRVYLLSTPGRTTASSRLDVFDPASGVLIRSARLPTALPTLAGDVSGRVYALDEFQLLAGVPERARAAAPAFDLPGLESGRITLAALRGKVTLVNLWASWCGPCREEMPALDSLRREFGDSAFAFVALSDDVDAGAARGFLRENRFDFPVGLGKGALRDQFHAPGLPVTVLVDRQGREVRRWIGFAGPAQIGSIRALIRAELDRAPATAGTHAAHTRGT
jgi:thiol-disulfide isomerase/thioredoxin